MNTSKIEHLNSALRTIRRVNRQLIASQDQASLLKAICGELVESRGYENAWIVLLDVSGRATAWAQAGVSCDIGEAVASGRFTAQAACVRQVLAQREMVWVENPASFCGTCPLADAHTGWGSVTVGLTHAGVLYGLLCVSIPHELVSEEVERALIDEIAGDIAFGIHRLEQEAAHRRTDAALGKRVNELNYFFSFSNLVERPGISLEAILKGGVELLAGAMQYPEVACARVSLGAFECRTDNYRHTDWNLSREIKVDGRHEGLVEVGYTEERPQEAIGPFQKEEQQLLQAAALRMGKIIERKRDRKALENSERRFRNLVENSLTCIAIMQGGRVVYCNPEYERLFGAGNNLLLPPNPDLIQAEDVRHVTRTLSDFTAGNLPWADLEFRYRAPVRGRSVRGVKWCHCRVSRIEHRGKEAVLLNLMDISHAKELEHLLRIKDKMTSPGRVAAGIAHEIRNPLSGINIYMKTLNKLCADGENAEEMLTILSQLQLASNKIEAVIKRVMDFSRPGEPAFVLTEINLPVREAVELSALTLRKKGVQIDMDLDPNLPPCRSDPHLIEQVILNLIANAWEAMECTDVEKRIKVSTRLEGDAVCVRVSDSGPGVPEGIMDDIFDPFYTTKENSSGIGLSICHRIVSDHGGSLAVAAGEWGGATFIVRIPVKRSS